MSEPFKDDRMVKGFISDGSSLIVSVNGNMDKDFGKESEDEMDTDSIPEDAVKIQFSTTEDPFRKDTISFDPRGKKVKDLRDYLRNYFQSIEECKGKPFMLKYLYHTVTLDEHLDDILSRKPILHFDISWGTDYKEAPATTSTNP